ncbi:hypothetical protein [Eudoraea sp.]|uniref:hypothetical protein n=1 Tax=Eudoraea sp. TaxID=1979955 RepID=UPI003296EE61
MDCYTDILVLSFLLRIIIQYSPSLVDVVTSNFSRPKFREADRAGSRDVVLVYAEKLDRSSRKLTSSIEFR